jgi:hypothetical protein
VGDQGEQQPRGRQATLVDDEYCRHGNCGEPSSDGEDAESRAGAGGVGEGGGDDESAGHVRDGDEGEGREHPALNRG